MDFDVSFCVPGMPFDGETLEKKSLGGSETAGVYMAKKLAKLGCHVHMFCNTEKQTQDADGVTYSPLGFYQQYIHTTPHDVTIAQRAPELFSIQTLSRLNILWCHDLALRRPEASTKFRSSLWNIDKVLVLSEFMKNQYEQVYGENKDLFHQTRNGIDLEAFAKTSSLKRKRNPHAILYTARPERGLDNLLQHVFPRVLAQDPEAELWFATYDNVAEHMIPFYQQVNRMASKLGSKRVRNFGALTKAQLYATMAEAAVYVYPTPSPASPDFAEVSCITAMECMAAGLPIVAGDVGAIVETTAGAATLISGNPWNPDVAQKYADAALKVMRNDDGAADTMRQVGLANAEGLSWDAVAQDWLQMFESEIRSRNNDRSRLFRHFWRQSDIVLAQKISDDDREVVDGQERTDRFNLLEPFNFAFEGPQGFVKQYERVASTHTPDSFEAAPGEPRFPALSLWLKSAKLGDNTPVDTVLDYGCGLGSYAWYAAQETGKRITAVDFDKRAIEIAREKSAAYTTKETTHVDYRLLDAVTGGIDDLTTGAGNLFDVGLMQEVLEHVAEPWAVAQTVERRVRKGGWVYITVPLGPWEYASYHTYPWRCHIWHFDLHDLRDMFGAKPDFSADVMAFTRSAETGEALGWWIVRYRADHNPIKPINLERKLWLQRPRQSVSANLIAGPGSEETLLWCLRSIYHLADEIIIGDASPEPNETLHQALKILNDSQPQWKWLNKIRIVRAPNPRAEGFERARNAVLAHSRMDWILWIDTDEKVVDAINLQKYFRDNIYQGYGIRQHHFACDVELGADMPVRMFRRGDHRGSKALQFWGAIHEHPERGVNEGPGNVVVVSDAHIAHVGYLNETIRQQRFIRNFPLLQLDQERYPDRLLQKHFVMRDNVQLARFALQQNGGRMDDSIRAKLLDTIDLYRKHFIGKVGYTNADSRQYYSEALAMLGEGFDVHLTLATDKLDAKPNGAIKTRYANREDFMKDLEYIAREKTSVYDEQWY